MECPILAGVTAGEHTLRVAPGQTNNNMQIHGVRIEKVQSPSDMLIQNKNSLVLNRNIGKNVSGTAYAALYLDGRFVDVYLQDVENESNVLFIIPNITGKEYDRASVFVWNNNLMPLCEAYTCTNLQTQE